MLALRFDAVLELRLAPLPAELDRLFEDRAVVFAGGLRAVDFLAVVERLVLLRGVLAAIEFSSVRPAIACLLAYPIGAPKTQRAKNCSASVMRLPSG